MVIETLAGGARIIGHVIAGGASSATLVYVDTEGNLSVNLLAARRRPAKVLGQLVDAMREIEVVHPAPEHLVDKILAAAAKAVLAE